MAQILTENQQKKALRKKKSNKQTIKNILSSSEESYWPLIKNNDVKLIKDSLEKYLPRIKQEKTTAKYEDIKNLSKDERKSFRKKLNINKDEELINNEKEFIIFGINHVDRSISNKQIAFVLIANDVTPRFILDGVIQDCLVNKTPFLIVPDLRKSLRKNCGINSMIMAIKKDVKEDSNLFILKEILKEVNQRYEQNSPSPTNDMKNVEVESIMEKNLNVEVKESVNLEDIYLIRKDKTKRVFEPNCNVEVNVVNSSDYLGFEEGVVKKVYKPLVVKRVRNDPNRIKKKLKKSK